MMRGKIIQTLKNVFSAGIVACIIVTLIITIGFIAAFIIGGNTAAFLCDFMKKNILPYEYVATGILAILGMIKMYLCGEKVFVMDIVKATDKNDGS